VFDTYWIMLIVSGILLLVVAGTGLGGLTIGLRVGMAIFGVLSLGYGLYLGFFFTGGEYWIAYKVFFIPIALIGLAIREAVDRRKERKAPPVVVHPPAPAGPPPANSPHLAYLQQPGSPQQPMPSHPPAGPQYQPPIAPQYQPPATSYQAPAPQGFQSPIQPG
jgi:hypothetical protein